MHIVKEYRLKHNLSQQQLADRIKRDRTLISQIERGLVDPSVTTGKEIAQVLGFDWPKIFEDKREK